ncbi:MAG: hypothetical protein AB7F86_05095 [Bdellovibrionales bacterium]
MIWLKPLVLTILFLATSGAWSIDPKYLGAYRYLQTQLDTPKCEGNGVRIGGKVVTSPRQVGSDLVNYPKIARSERRAVLDQLRQDVQQMLVACSADSSANLSKYIQPSPLNGNKAQNKLSPEPKDRDSGRTNR